jgi:hypothetical protein
MHRLISFRAALIAIVAVIFSATIAFAGQPSSHAAQGLANAASHAGQAVPDQTGDESSETTETDQSDTDTSETETSSESADAADNCTVDLSGDLSGFTHGAIVCTAAHMDTPDGYANHGAWVSHWATMNKGADASATGKAHKPSH